MSKQRPKTQSILSFLPTDVLEDNLKSKIPLEGNKDVNKILKNVIFNLEAPTSVELIIDTTSTDDQGRVGLFVKSAGRKTLLGSTEPTNIVDLFSKPGAGRV